ncbi:MAG: class II aldolase/adducin family protein [Candidatus Promineifilaceae bacterium]|nr:class II aldolase/adducin family protein [Candidatus Promineifilaceae bacterium]
MKLNLIHPRDQLVNIMNRIYDGGMTTLSGGNLSIKDENGDLWITPASVDKGKLTPQDIMCVHEEGTIVGPHKPSSEYPFHRAIYVQRPDLRAVVHAHPPALVSFSIVRQVPDTNIIPQANRLCGPVGYASYALPGSEQLGENIAASFGKGYNIVILENHGLVTGGTSLLTAFQRLETLDFCARTLIRAQMLGQVNLLSEAELSFFDGRPHELPEFQPSGVSSRVRELRQQIVEIVRRAVSRQLMISTEGVVSVRLDENNFLITPTGKDRGALDIDDVVRIHNGARGHRNLPSRSVRLHEAIYNAHPDINSVMMAQCPNAMAYAVTATPFDTRTIPESYIMLRSIPQTPFKTLYTNPQQVADTISLSTPVLLAQNDCVLTVGSNVLQAFDRLEVAEFSAKSLIDAAGIGKMIPIGAEEIHDLKVSYSLT